MWSGLLKRNQQRRCNKTLGECMVDEMCLQDVTLNSGMIGLWKQAV